MRKHAAIPIIAIAVLLTGCSNNSAKTEAAASAAAKNAKSAFESCTTAWKQTKSASDQHNPCQDPGSSGGIENEGP